MRPPGLLILLFAITAGCAQRQPAEQPATQALEPGQAESIVKTWNERVDALSRVARRGVIEFEWTDETGRRKREPQVNLGLWIRLPHDTALCAEKAGREVWLGSDASRVWFFDMMGDEDVLQVARRDAGSVAFFGVSPDLLIEVLGLGRLPEGAEPTGAADGSLTYRVQGSECPLMISLDPATALPTRIEALHEDPALSLIADLTKYDSVPIAGRSPLAFPQFPGRAVVVNVERTIEIAIFTEEPARSLDEQPWSRLFDLEVLERRFKPDRRIDLEERRTLEWSGDDA